MSAPTSIYLDHAATSPVLPEVLDAMMPWFTTEFGNPSSVYGRGRKARHALESCRGKVAGILGVGPAEIVFTSGGSESNNTVLSSQAAGQLGVLTSSVEHEAVLEPIRLLDKHHVLATNQDGRITTKELDVVDPTGLGLASFMLVNNELGTINPIRDISAWCRARDMLVHTDAAQGARTLDLKPIVESVDYLSLTGHKFGAPKGIGLLFVRAGVPHAPLILGGGQEQGRRSGTENIAFAVGITKALELADAQRETFVSHAKSLRHRLLLGLTERLPTPFRLVSPESDCSPHIVNLLVLKEEETGVDGEMLILGLDIEGIAVSAGSACSSGTMKVSHVLESIGISGDQALGALRISFGPQTTADEVDDAVSALGRVMDRMS